MRGVVLLAWLAGCGFEVAATGDDVRADGGVDASLETPPDSLGGPGCLTSPAYANGPEAGHRYRKLTGRDRDSAVDACTADGAHLATVGSAQEDMFIRMIGGANFWIGLDDLGQENKFRWVTEEALGYERFEGIEPNNSGNEDCVMVTGNGTWNDTDCGETHEAVCECEASYTPRPTPACRAMPGVTHFGRKYIIREGAGASKPWPTAKMDCEMIGAHLPIFSDRDEESPVNREFIGDNWMGLSDIATEGTFVWLDGTSPVSSQIHWNLSSPHNNDTGRNCVRIFTDWQDDPCTDSHEYACECEP